jgi:hypothetical protein
VAQGLNIYKLVVTVAGVILAMVISGVYDLELLGAALLLAVNAWVFFGIVRANWLRVLFAFTLLISIVLYVSQMNVPERAIQAPIFLVILSAVFLIANICLYVEAFRKRKSKAEP